MFGMFTANLPIILDLLYPFFNIATFRQKETGLSPSKILLAEPSIYTILKILSINTFLNS